MNKEVNTTPGPSRQDRECATIRNLRTSNKTKYGYLSWRRTRPRAIPTKLHANKGATEDKKRGTQRTQRRSKGLVARHPSQFGLSDQGTLQSTLQGKAFRKRRKLGRVLPSSVTGFGEKDVFGGFGSEGPKRLHVVAWDLRHVVLKTVL